jgi:hypothetical protein
MPKKNPDIVSIVLKIRQSEDQRPVPQARPQGNRKAVWGWGAPFIARLPVPSANEKWTRRGGQ